MCTRWQGREFGRVLLTSPPSRVQLHTSDAGEALAAASAVGPARSWLLSLSLACPPAARGRPLRMQPDSAVLWAARAELSSSLPL
jgi:hypothetical protein